MFTAPETRVALSQGQVRATRDPAMLFGTLLGSCVACCLHDPDGRIGGMNHFLLPEPHPGMRPDDGAAGNYGLFAMERLVAQMLAAGARREGLRAHLYGGADLHSGMRAIGSRNADFARSWLAQAGIALVHSHLGGRQARRIDFRAALGQARCRLVESDRAAA